MKKNQTKQQARPSLVSAMIDSLAHKPSLKYVRELERIVEVFLERIRERRVKMELEASSPKWDREV
jgi:ribosome maturation factor RimP